MARALKTCQYIGLKHLINGDKSHDRGHNIDLEMLNHCFKDIFPQGFRDTMQLWHILEEYGNSHFCLFRNYLNTQHNVDLAISCQQPLFRHIWLSADNENIEGRVQLLSKGGLWCDNLHSTIGRGEKASPLIDYIDGMQPYMYVSAEQQCDCPPMKWCLPYNKSSLPYAVQTHSTNLNTQVIKLGWKCKCDNDNSLYTYCIVEKDTWFYSKFSDISVAYHEYLHT